MSKQVDERRVIQRMDKVRNRWEEDTDSDGGYVTWREVLKLAIFLLVLVVLILRLGSLRDSLLRDMQEAHDAKDWKLYWEIQAAIEQIDQRDEKKNEWDEKMKGKGAKCEQPQ
jgi:hypothetical protein